MNRIGALLAVAVVTVLDLLAEPRRGAAQNDRTAASMTWATWVLVVGNWALVVLTLWAVLDNRKALDRSHRAWVVPGGAVLEEPLSVGQSPKVLVKFDNVGHEPALAMRLEAEPAIVDVSPIHVTEAEASALADRLCGGAIAVASSRAVYPRGDEPPYEVRPDFANHIVVGGPVLDDQHWFVLRGCFVYEAADETRRTTFCYFQAANIAAGRPLRNCPYGDFAD